MAEPNVKPSRYKGERNSDPAFFFRYPSLLSYPDKVFTATFWRNFVKGQLVASICKETLIGNVLSLDWHISTRDPNLREELRADVEYYTQLFTSKIAGGYSSFVEWVLSDYLDLPFGGAVEIGRKGDREGGKVLWIEPVDGGTLYPTHNRDYPVAQWFPEMTTPVYFPAHAIARVFYSPRTDILNRGWGIAPPEKAYLGIQMLSKGDNYYWQAISDTPQAGILDLGDMEESAAKAWIGSFRDLMGGIDPLKVPVLYEHTTQAKYIPFGMPPSELLYNDVTARYASLVASTYGLTLSDIGYSSSSNGGDTLAGSIRSERKSRKNGYGRVKIKLKEFMDSILPDTLQFNLIDFDDELNLNLARARLASATAYREMINSTLLTDKEARLQYIADGLSSIPLSEDIDDAELRAMAERRKLVSPVNESGNERITMVGAPQTASLGGYGERVQKFEDVISHLLVGEWTDIEINSVLKSALGIEGESQLTEAILSALSWYNERSGELSVSDVVKFIENRLEENDGT